MSIDRGMSLQSQKNVINLQIDANFMLPELNDQSQHLHQNKPQLSLIEMFVTIDQIFERVVIVLHIQRSDLILDTYILLWVRKEVQCLLVVVRIGTTILCAYFCTHSRMRMNSLWRLSPEMWVLTAFIRNLPSSFWKMSISPKRAS